MTFLVKAVRLHTILVKFSVFQRTVCFGLTWWLKAYGSVFLTWEATVFGQWVQFCGKTNVAPACGQEQSHVELARTSAVSIQKKYWKKQTWQKPCCYILGYSGYVCIAKLQKHCVAISCHISSHVAYLNRETGDTETTLSFLIPLPTPHRSLEMAWLKIRPQNYSRRSTSQSIQAPFIWIGKCL